MSYRSVYLTILISLSFISFSLAFQPQTKEELQTAVDLWVSDNASALSTYGTINSWNVSLITDMSDLFKEKTTFNDDISNWNVSNVTTMGRMFQECRAFNQDISSWDVSSVTNMGGVGAAGGGGSHGHGSIDVDVQYVDVIIATKD